MTDHVTRAKGLMAQAVADMSGVATEIARAIADFEPQYLRVFESHIDNARRRVREADSALASAQAYVALAKNDDGTDSR